MTERRDPRVDPAKGDALRWGRAVSRVTEVTAEKVRFTQEGLDARFRAYRHVTLKRWRYLAAEAFVVVVARPRP